MRRGRLRGRRPAPPLPEGHHAPLGWVWPSDSDRPASDAKMHCCSHPDRES
jgi:hypothetical protein